MEMSEIIWGRFFIVCYCVPVSFFLSEMMWRAPWVVIISSAQMSILSTVSVLFQHQFYFQNTRGVYPTLTIVSLRLLICVEDKEYSLHNLNCLHLSMTINLFHLNEKATANRRKLGELVSGVSITTCALAGQIPSHLICPGSPPVTPSTSNYVWRPCLADHCDISACVCSFYIKPATDLW